MDAFSQAPNFFATSYSAVTASKVFYKSTTTSPHSYTLGLHTNSGIGFGLRLQNNLSLSIGFNNQIYSGTSTELDNLIRFEEFQSQILLSYPLEKSNRLRLMTGGYVGKLTNATSSGGGGSNSLIKPYFDPWDLGLVVGTSFELNNSGPLGFRPYCMSNIGLKNIEGEDQNIGQSTKLMSLQVGVSLFYWLQEKRKR